MKIAVITGVVGFLFCAAFQNLLDERIRRLWRWIAARYGSRVSVSQPHRILLLTRLIASLRAGISLDSGLESAARDSSTPAELRTYLEKILEAKPGGDFLAEFLHDALRTGTPVLATLQIFQKLMQVERRVKMKASALTSQSRAQAEVLSWLPWVMLFALAVMDWEWFSTATKSASSWLLWSISLLLLGGGRAWMASVLDRALRPGKWGEILEESLLPELVLRMIGGLSLGIDAETALEKSLARLNNSRLSAEFSGRHSHDSVLALRSLLTHAALTGAPLREDLTRFLTDLHLQIESRWEERVQRLPVVMMAPLFLCFFPSCLLILFATLLPLLTEAL